MTKLSNEIKQAKNDETVDYILNFVSHIDLKREYKASWNSILYCKSLNFIVNKLLCFQLQLTQLFQ